ncbi:MAG: metal ABC transporter permease [Proteobacteria bacterium]|nr:metal ABC transporter permease [Pseudomonadota bacterium]
MDDFLLRALLGGIGVAMVAGPLGAFVVWRRMAYFGAAMAHSALLGVALGLLLELDLNVAVIAVCGALAVLVAALERYKGLATDTVLGIVAHVSLAVALVALAFMETARVDLFAYLFGDILAVTRLDLVWIYGGGLTALAAVVAMWRPLLAATVHEELAEVEGAPVAGVRLAFMLLLALVIAVGLKVVGLLLITSLLIIPAAAARRVARTPEQMAVIASAIGCLAVAGGLYGSLRWDSPAGPSIVVAAAVLFTAVTLATLAFTRRG